MATSFSGGRSPSTRREPPTMGKQLVNFITCGCELSAPFSCNLQSRARTHAVLVIYKKKYLQYKLFVRLFKKIRKFAHFLIIFSFEIKQKYHLFITGTCGQDTASPLFTPYPPPPPPPFFYFFLIFHFHGLEICKTAIKKKKIKKGVKRGDAVSCPQVPLLFITKRHKFNRRNFGNIK